MKGGDVERLDEMSEEAYEVNVVSKRACREA